MVHTIVFAVARFVGFLSRLTRSGSGGTIPGRVALLFRPEALSRLTADRAVVLVSATNGKTTTTRLLAAAVRSLGPVASNESGSNLESGLITALLSARPTTTAVLEVDEVVLPRAIACCNPRAVVLLNLSRDQLDRTSEVALHVERWREALTKTRCVVVANADDPLVVRAVRGARPDSRDVIWVAVGQRWRSDVAVCPECGRAWKHWSDPWSCEDCGSGRPHPVWRVEDGRLVSEDVAVPLTLALPGRANESNAAMAAVAASALGVPLEVACAGMAEVHEVAGRYVQHRLGPHDLRMLLVKNPAGWMETLEEMPAGAPVIIAVNARSADGTDPSWLWDVPFEALGSRTVVVTGERATDLSARLYYAGIDFEIAPDVWAALDRIPPGACDLVANYTAFVDARRVLAQGRP